MKLNCDHISKEDYKLALQVRNYLINGNRVIGNPGEGLKITLKELEHQRDSKEWSIMDWQMDDVELKTQISLIKAGIEGEEKLCEYLTRLIKYDKDLDGLVAFASLSYEQENNDKDYIPDTDTLLVYGNNALVVDAKHIKLKNNQTLMLVDGVIVDDKGKEILAVHPSTHIWENVFTEHGIEYGDIDGYVCIVSNTPVDIIRNDEWYMSHTKLIHISELRGILHEWTEGVENTLHLNMLTEIAKAQIKKEKNLELDLDDIKKQLNV